MISEGHPDLLCFSHSLNRGDVDLAEFELFSTPLLQLTTRRMLIAMCALAGTLQSSLSSSPPLLPTGGGACAAAAMTCVRPSVRCVPLSRSDGCGIVAMPGGSNKTCIAGVFGFRRHLGRHLSLGHRAGRRASRGSRSLNPTPLSPPTPRLLLRPP